MNPGKLGNVSDLINNLPVGVFTVNLDMQITFYNREAESITGFSREDALGCKCFEIFRAKLCNDRSLKNAIRKGISTSHVRNSILTKDNREISVILNCTPIRDNGCNIIGGMESFLVDKEHVHLKRFSNGDTKVEDIITCDEKMKNLINIVKVIAPYDFPVLLIGETGTGKDLFARQIHNLE